MREDALMKEAPESPGRATILVVDDAPANLSLMNKLLEPHYKVKLATNGENALRIAAAEPPPDLILLDVVMPEMDGYEVCRRIMADERTRQIPVIFLTAKAEIEDERKGLELGAVDYITKPISPPIVMARVKTHLGQKKLADFLRDNNDFLEQEVAKRTREVMANQDVTILAMAFLAETRDSDTGGHIRRTQYYVKTLAMKLRDHPRFSDFLTDDNIDMLFKTSPLHDIGKVGIPDRILQNTGRFEPHELEIMKSHTTLGRDAIEYAQNALGTNADFLVFAKPIAYSHQEKWDGTGYPQGLAGDGIPIAARLMAVADVYDALISRRVYKEGMPHEKAAKILIEGRGSHFDPDMIDAFIEIQDEFRAIAKRFADSDADISKKKEYQEKAGTV
jgi:putative two-component system response regulator